MADELIQAKGHQTRIVNIDEEWNVETELENHQWADTIILQTPVNWMGVPWTFKKYMDEVYTAGMGGNCAMVMDATKTAPRRTAAKAARSLEKHTCCL